MRKARTITCLVAFLISFGRVLAVEPATQPSQPAQATSGPASMPAARLNVLCSTFPIYLFTRNVAAGRDNIHLRLLVSSELGCPHDYVLTPQDMQALTSADAIVLNGLGMETFLDKPLKKAKAALKVIDSSAGLTGLIELKEPIHEHPHEEAEHKEHEPIEPAFNPHLFASPLRAAGVVKNIAKALAELDPAGAATYRANAQAYAERLEKIAADFSALATMLPNHKIVTQHAVMDYLAKDAGLEIVAVLQETAGQEPSAAGMIELIRRIKDGGAAAVFTEPQYSPKVAQTIAREVGAPLAVLDPLANGPADAPLDYYEKVMAENLKTLKKVLGPKDK